MAAVPANVADIELDLLLEAIFRRYHYDFRDYARPTLARRLEQALAATGCETLSELQARLLRDPAVFADVLERLTVQVSDLFRDPSYYRAIRERVVPELETHPSLKIWIAGCATGEEVYSFAILLREEGLLERSLLYATDVSPTALRAAQRGVFPLERVAQFSLNYREAGGKGSLSDYYTAGYGGAVFDRSLLKNVVFSDHDLATDSVFAETQLISCRNVLIYFDRQLQDRALGLFRDSLCRGGFLGLGSRESLRFSVHSDSFADFVPEEKLYRRRAE